MNKDWESDELFITTPSSTKYVKELTARSKANDGVKAELRPISWQKQQ